MTGRVRSGVRGEAIAEQNSHETATNGTATRRHRALSGRLETFAFQTLAFQLTGATHGFGLFSGAALRGLLVIATQLHFTENPFALHFLLERLQGLIDVVVTNEYLHVSPPLLYA